ncbi:MAG TPA: hypothetical protein VER03_24790 [Bryobacteraceae bacterium]|nr:hypothetical protein [Bryobacteraceae bacterium]
MVEEVRSICTIENPLIRNLRITECYHRLSATFAQRVGPGANWCAFATWASRQAGCTIRGEDLIEHLSPRTPRLWRAVLRMGVLDPQTPAGWIVKHVHTPFDAVERASASVAKGNLKVFEEIGEVFARWLDDSSYVPSQPLLRDAFEHYRLAAEASSANERARWMVIANIECGLHEQRRLQPEIEGAMTAPLWLFKNLLKDLVCEIVSQGFMTLKLPGDRRLRLGDDLDAPAPACFEGMEREPLLAQFETAGIGGVGAENWADLQQRMRYISRLFRCFHEDAALFQPPFSVDQCETMRSGQLPRGVL